MPKTDNPHALRLYDSLLKQTDAQTAERIANKIALSKSADEAKKFTWAESICADLQHEFDDARIKEIRMDCACCGPDAGRMNAMRTLYQSSADLDDFTAKVNQQNKGFTLRNNGDHLLMIYPKCYCSCVKRVDQPLSKVWCYCTLGYAKKLFGYAFDRAVEVRCWRA